MDQPPTNASPLLELAKFAVFLWPLVWFIPSGMCCSAPLTPLATPAGELANVLRVFASPIALAAGAAAGSAVLSVFETVSALAHLARDTASTPPGDHRVPSGFALASLTLCATYVAVYTGIGLLTGALAGAVVVTTLAYAFVATYTLAALVTPFALLILGRRLAASAANE